MYTNGLCEWCGRQLYFKHTCWVMDKDGKSKICPKCYESYSELTNLKDELFNLKIPFDLSDPAGSVFYNGNPLTAKWENIATTQSPPVSPESLEKTLREIEKLGPVPVSIMVGKALYDYLREHYHVVATSFDEIRITNSMDIHGVHVKRNSFMPDWGMLEEYACGSQVKYEFSLVKGGE